MANFTGLAAGRDEVLRQAGWDVGTRGLVGAPAGPGAGRRRAARHRRPGAALPRPRRTRGRAPPTTRAGSTPPHLAAALEQYDGPTLVCVQAGNVHSGGYDPFAEAIEVAHRHGAWVHVDGAFGLFAAAAPAYRHLTEGFAGADSWATDAHKTLNVPYDCGIAIVRDPAAVKAAMGMHGDYLIHDEAGDPFEKVPELSRRARSVPVYAVLAALGRQGVADLVERMAGHAAAFARGIARPAGRRGAQRRGLHAGLRQLRRRRAHPGGRGPAPADGEAWMSGSLWRGRAVLRISVSNWSTTEGDVGRSLRALARAAAAVERAESGRGGPVRRLICRVVGELLNWQRA